MVNLIKKNMNQVSISHINALISEADLLDWFSILEKYNFYETNVHSPANCIRQGKLD